MSRSQRCPIDQSILTRAVFTMLPTCGLAVAGAPVATLRSDCVRQDTTPLCPQPPYVRTCCGAARFLDSCSSLRPQFSAAHETPPYRAANAVTEPANTPLGHCPLGGRLSVADGPSGKEDSGGTTDVVSVLCQPTEHRQLGQVLRAHIPLPDHRTRARVSPRSLGQSVTHVSLAPGAATRAALMNSGVHCYGSTPLMD